MAIVLSKLFMRQISQTHSEDQTGISLWTLADIEKAQAKQREIDLELELAAAVGADRDIPSSNAMDIDEFGDGGLSDRMLEDIDLDV